MVSVGVKRCLSLQVRPPGEPASLYLKFADDKEETVDISCMHSGQVVHHIKSRIQEKDMAAVLSKNEFVGKQLETRWGI